MFCNNCGVQTDENAKFCENCGQPVSPGSPAQTQPAPEYRQWENMPPEQAAPKKRAGKGLLIGAAACVILAVLVAVIFFLRVLPETDRDNDATQSTDSGYEDEDEDENEDEDADEDEDAGRGKNDKNGGKDTDADGDEDREDSEPSENTEEPVSTEPAALPPAETATPPPVIDPAYAAAYLDVLGIYNISRNINIIDILGDETPELLLTASLNDKDYGGEGYFIIFTYDKGVKQVLSGQLAYENDGVYSYILTGDGGLYLYEGYGTMHIDDIPAHVENYTKLVYHAGKGFTEAETLYSKTVNRETYQGTFSDSYSYNGNSISADEHKQRLDAILSDSKTVASPVYNFMYNEQDEYGMRYEGAVEQLNREVSASGVSEYLPSEATSRQKLLVSSSGSDASVTLLQWNGQTWGNVFSASGKVGVNGVGANYGEGKKITPKGKYNILFCYGINTPYTGLRFMQLISGDVFIDDSSSPWYNMILNEKYSSLDKNISREKTYEQFSRGVYSTNLFFDYNGDGETVGTATPKMGSVYTVCGYSGALKATAGCIDISSADMTRLVALLDQAYHPVIIID